MKRSLPIAFFLSLSAACGVHLDAFEKSVMDYRHDAKQLATEPCQYDCSLEQDVARMRLKQLDALDLSACKGQGGLVGGIGIFGDAACIKYFSDGGRKCVDSSDCQGNCMVYGAFKPGDIVEGQCASQSPEPGGCFAEVANGKALPGICI